MYIMRLVPIVLLLFLVHSAVATQEVDGVQICTMTIPCGVDDGICPEDFFDPVTGQQISCEGVRDIDCMRGGISTVFSGNNAFFVDGYSNPDADVELMSQGVQNNNYVATFLVEGAPSPSSVTTITFSSSVTSAPAIVLFDNRALLDCGVYGIEPCYTFDAPTLQIYHPLSKHLIQIVIDRGQSQFFPYFLVVLVLMLIPLVFIAAQRRQFMKDLDIYLDQMEHQVHMPHGSLQKLHTYIEKQLKAGKHRESIRKDLLKAGWETHVVDLVMHRHHVPHKDIGRLKIYIYKLRNEGQEDTKIITLLKSRGWKDEQIKEAMG